MMKLILNIYTTNNERPNLAPFSPGKLMSQPKTYAPGHLGHLVPVGMPPSGLHLLGVARLPTFFLLSTSALALARHC